MKYLIILTTALATVLVANKSALAQDHECDKLTYLTFNAPVGLPGVTLPAGTYRFSHINCEMSVHILRVSSKDGRQVYGTFLTIPYDRMTPGGTEVVLAEMPVGSPEAIKAWFYPGETTGDELMYSKKEAPRVAEAPERDVVAANGLA